MPSPIDTQVEELSDFLVPVFDLEPGKDEWTVTGPTPESPPHKAANPLNDPELKELLATLKESVRYCRIRVSMLKRSLCFVSRWS